MPLFPLALDFLKGPGSRIRPRHASFLQHQKGKRLLMQGIKNYHPQQPFLFTRNDATHTGIISAKIEFLDPVNVTWFEDDFTETTLGSMTFDPLFAKHKRAPINATSTFTITDQDAFGTGTNNVIDPGPNDITLVGFLKPQTTPEDLALVSELFTNYLNGESSPVIATGVSTLQSDNSTISWLSQGLQSLALNVPFKSFNAINPIQSIDIGNLGLKFDENASWTPSADSNSVQAALELPFGFSIAIDQIQNDFTIVTLDGANVAGLSTPLGASKSTISVLGPTDTQGTINISISNTNLSCPDPQHVAFSSFNANLTSLDVAEFRLVGTSRAVANTSLGQITLDAIKVNVSTSLHGLQGLKGLVAIESVDVQGGTQDGINLGIDVSIDNPSDLDLSTGDLTLQLSRDGVVLGTALIPNLVLTRGNNTFHATSNFEANNSPQGQQTLNDFVGKKDVQLNISGFNGSTNIASLVEAFETLNLSVVLPGLKTSLIATADLTILPTTGRTNNISHVTVSLVNPFSAPLQITKISSTVKSFGLPLGTIDSNVDFKSAPNSTTQSPTLDLNMNFDPAVLFTVTRALAVEAGLDVDPLDGIVALGGIKYLSITGDPPKLKRRANVFDGFDLPKFVNTAFKKLQSDVELNVDVTIGESSGTLVASMAHNRGLGDYQTTLQYTQSGVPTATDESLDYILPVLAQPIVQQIAMLTEETFEWDISGQNLSVNALGISVPGVTFTSRTITLKGFNGLKGGVTIKTFDLPSDDPAGGIHLTLDATTENPSQVGISVSSIGFDTYIGDVLVAPVLSAGAVTLAPGSTSDLSLVGRLVPQTSAIGLATVSGVFSNFVHGQDSNVEVRGASAGSPDVTWLNEGIKALRVSSVLPNRGPQNIIKSITLNELQLIFTENTAYDPSASSRSTDAAFTLPFGFPLDITALEQTLNVAFEGTSFAQLALPKAPSTTDVENRIIHLTFDGVPFAVFSDQHSTFDKFVATTTVGKSLTLQLSGTANADAQTAVGLLTLQDIDFSVDSSINGLQGLNAKPVSVGNVDVNRGFADYLLIKVDSSLFNPSNLTIGTGDVSFSLEFQDQTIGVAEINDLVIQPGSGNYSIDVHYAPQGNAVSAGRTLLQNFVEGVDVDTTIAGTTGSTPIPSLQSALSQIHLSPVSLPGLHGTLITSASLSFPIDIVNTGVATTSFTIANPFTASINLLTVGATATYHGILLGTINNVDTSSNPIHASGHSSVTSPTLPLEFDLQPQAIIQLLTIASQANGVDLGPLTQLFQFVIGNPNFKPPVVTSVDTNAPTCVSGQQFDASGAILKTLSNLKVDLAVDTSLKLDDCEIVTTDKTSLYLIGAVAGPVTQYLVDGSVLAFTEANITNISNEGFDLALTGSLTNVGPLDALIEFVEPLVVSWQGQDIATISLPPVCAAANSGVPDYRANAHLTITDTSAFTSFATFLLHNPSFDWTVSTSKLRLTALGTIFDGVTLSKVLSFKAFNGLPGVTISNFLLPSDDPAGGIHIETDASIPSPSQLGIDLGSITFQSFFQDTLVGPLSGEAVFLKAGATNNIHLSGRIIPQTGADLDNIGVLFSHFLAGQNQTLTTKGNSVQPSGSDGPVTWLSTAFQTLSLEVTLPGQKFDVIQSIALNDLSLTVDTPDQAFAPPTSSQFTLATYKNPFGFALQVIEAGQTLILNSGGVDIAQLTIPKEAAAGGVSTGNVADLVVSWEDVPLKSLNSAAFTQLFAAVTLMDDINLTIEGNADVTAKTSIGNVALTGIPFNVPSSLKGINSFGNKAVLSNVSVSGSGGDGGNEYIISPLITTLQNPSNVTLDTVDVSLPVMYQGTKIGRTVVNDFHLVPGENASPAEFHYQPDNANDTTAQAFLGAFMQSGGQLDLTIMGDMDSSPFASLSPGLSQLQLVTSLQGLNQPQFITHITVTITLETLVDNLVSVNFDVHNPLGTDLVLEFVQSNSGVDGTTYAFFGQAFDSFIVPPGQTVNSGDFPNVLLTQGAFASLDIIPLGVLDVSAATTLRVGGQDGYLVPWLILDQTGVPTTYNLALTEAAMMAKAKSISASSSSSATATSSTEAEGSATATATEASATGQSTSTFAPAVSSSAASGSGTKSSSAPAAESEPTVTQAEAPATTASSASASESTSS
ncbi:hypothetical protein C0991_011030 [Blastosporella zonata]|nr:hypothetical protein C0991_011030 [Blastosporella zonata]